MSRVIRNYRSGAQVIVSDQVREYGVREQPGSTLGNGQRGLENAQHEVEKLRLEAADLLAQAEARAMEMREETQALAATLQAEAQAKGYEDGYKQGIADAQQKTDAAVAQGAMQMQQMVDELAGQRKAILANMEAEVAMLSMAIAEKIVGHIARSYEPLILHTVGRALALLSAEEGVVVHLHPDDRRALESHWQTPGHEGVPAPGTWRLVTDSTIDRGGCLLTCGPTTVDARLSTQLRGLVEGLQLSDYDVDQETP